MRRKIFILLAIFLCSVCAFGQNRMMYGDTTRLGVPFSKDPHVVEFHGRYLMYYTIPAGAKGHSDAVGWGIGIAESRNLKDWHRVGEVKKEGPYLEKGFCAPCALVRNDTVHIFFQGSGPKDSPAYSEAICHAWSVDGINFTQDPSNPIFSSRGTWNCGRAIDAEVVKFNGQYYMYFASRTPDHKNQLIGVAVAPDGTDFSRGSWSEPVDKSILFSEYPWEGICIEAPSVIQVGDSLFMFYAGAYNNAPQQIGLAVSSDGISWKKVSNKPFLENGDLGSWNYCESGHPHIFRNSKGKTYLFYQGNDDFGKTWYLSNLEIKWKHGRPVIKK
jgi:predicted GH43/DUF377 family glycosyl hydrolase